MGCRVPNLVKAGDELLGVGRNVKRFRGGLVLKAHRLLYHSTLVSRVIKKKKKNLVKAGELLGVGRRAPDHHLINLISVLGFGVQGFGV